jgi:hypothetical protein
MNLVKVKVVKLDFLKRFKDIPFPADVGRYCSKECLLLLSIYLVHLTKLLD